MNIYPKNIECCLLPFIAGVLVTIPFIAIIGRRNQCYIPQQFGPLPQYFY